MDTEVRLFEVGGCVRDEFLGHESKDVDFAVEAPSFDAMLAYLKANDFHVFVVTERFLTARCAVPESNPLRARTKVADFVLCRKDSPGSDGRRPDYVEPGTILDDLARRDFTMNAMARDLSDGSLLDPFDGRRDLKAGLIRFVGDPRERILEDGLRVLRALRFSVTKGMALEALTSFAVYSPLAADLLRGVSVERVLDEVRKMLVADTLGSMRLFATLGGHTRDAIFRDGLRLEPTLKHLK